MYGSQKKGNKQRADELYSNSRWLVLFFIIYKLLLSFFIVIDKGILMKICKSANIFVFIWQNNMTKVSHCTFLCLIVGGGGQIANFGKKNPHVDLIMIRE